MDNLERSRNLADVAPKRVLRNGARVPDPSTGNLLEMQLEQCFRQGVVVVCENQRAIPKLSRREDLVYCDNTGALDPPPVFHDTEDCILIGKPISYHCVSQAK